MYVSIFSINSISYCWKNEHIKQPSSRVINIYIYFWLFLFLHTPKLWTQTLEFEHWRFLANHTQTRTSHKRFDSVIIKPLYLFVESLLAVWSKFNPIFVKPFNHFSEVSALHNYIVLSNISQEVKYMHEHLIILTIHSPTFQKVRAQRIFPLFPFVLSKNRYDVRLDERVIIIDHNVLQ